MSKVCIKNILLTRPVLFTRPSCLQRRNFVLEARWSCLQDQISSLQTRPSCLQGWISSLQCVSAVKEFCVAGTTVVQIITSYLQSWRPDEHTHPTCPSRQPTRLHSACMPRAVKVEFAERNLHWLTVVETSCLCFTLSGYLCFNKNLFRINLLNSTCSFFIFWWIICILKLESHGAPVIICRSTEVWTYTHPAFNIIMRTQ
jgi:hypothetical protein